jgi:uncharacterized protein YydD (DUF2326 family)
MLARFWSGRLAAPGFLIHGSTLFGGVDERHSTFSIRHFEKGV